MSSKKGIEVVKAVMAYMSNTTGYDRVMKSINVISGGNGKILAELKVAPEHLNRGGGLHGGFIATLVDNVTSVALMTNEKNDVAGVSVDMHISYLKAAREGDEVLIEANTVKAGANLAFLECILRHKKDNSVIARGSHTKYVGAALQAKKNL